MREKVFSMRLYPLEQRVLKQLASVYGNRSQAEVVRFLIRQIGLSSGILTDKDISDMVRTTSKE